MAKVRLLLDSCNRCSWKAFIPGQGISIDESMCPYKGSFAFKQFIQSKRTRFGIKMWSMCCGNTGYVLRISPYTGAWTELGTTDEATQSGSVVKNFARLLSHTGSIIHIDNYYTSVDVCDSLYRMGLGCIGTLRMNRVGIPKRLRNTNKKSFPAKPKGGPVFWLRKASEENAYPLVCIAWQDKKPVGFLSTVHSSRLIKKPCKSKYPSRRLVEVPEIVIEYTNNMGGVDLSDQRRKSYPYPHPARKWYIHLYHYLVENCMNNSHITFNDLRIYEREKITALAFRQELTEAFLSLAEVLEHSDVRDMTGVPENAYTKFVPRSRRKDTSDRLSGRHFVEKVDMKGFSGRQCVVCRSTYHKRHQVKYMCPDCDVYLCPVECFKIFHTVEDYANLKAV